MKLYFARLKNHPGLPVAAFLSAAFTAAGLLNKNMKTGLITGIVFTAIIWLTVLWTARDQPLASKVEDEP